MNSSVIEEAWATGKYRCTPKSFLCSLRKNPMCFSMFLYMLNVTSLFYLTKSKSSQSHIAIDVWSVSNCWCRAPDINYYRLTVTVLFLWGSLSDERTGLSLVYAAGSCQRSLSRVRVPWDLRPYFTVSDLRHPFSSPPTTRKVTVEVFDPASTRGTHFYLTCR
jgi:hypothetical protein